MFGALVKKELLALIRDPHALGALFLMPALFIVVMSLALKDVYRPPLATQTWALVNQDADSAAVRTLVQRWSDLHAAPQALPDDWQYVVQQGKLNYVIVIEPGFAQALAMSGTPQSDYGRARLLVEPGMNAALLAATQADFERLVGEIRARILIAKMGGDAVGMTLGAQHLYSIERYGDQLQPSSVQQSVPAWLVFGMFFIVAALSYLFVEEQRSGTLARLVSLGVPSSILIATKIVPYLAINLIQAALMLAVGIWLVPALGGDALSLAGVHPSTLISAVIAISIAAISLALLLACLMRTTAQTLVIGPLLMILLAAIGGIMVPTAVMPAGMQRLAMLSPLHWADEALRSVLLRHATLHDTLPLIAQLIAFALVAFIIALILFRRRIVIS